MGNLKIIACVCAWTPDCVAAETGSRLRATNDACHLSLSLTVSLAATFLSKKIGLAAMVSRRSPLSPSFSKQKVRRLCWAG